ncbi:uncharacterized protein LTR77_004521 [Saxophila tyrrhenica]|uniref:Uncharacterized protein n=1 Tax=Saxophila tyrrhenica TaxID=1690608 RepID=A0AAV9PD05_9PEZI|nr:hypothetical protein LTR77_004521 [Saxophila tyrrhenica]
MARFRSARNGSYCQLTYPVTSKPKKRDLIEQLKRHGYRAKTRLTHAQLLELVHANVHEYIEFRKIRLSKLERFAHARGLELPEEATKDALVPVLIKADNERQFSKIFDLPPELRVLIEEFHLSDFARRWGLLCLNQPPLARTCRLLRNDVLPLFYSHCKFIISFDIERAPACVPGDEDTPGELVLTQATQKFGEHPDSVHQESLCPRG